MLKTINPLLKNGLFLIVIALFFSSCISQKEIKYLQPASKKGANKSEFNRAAIQEYRFNYGDNAYINIRSLDEKSNEMFNSSSGNRTTTSYNDASIYLNSYH